jgi:DNA-binding GntR family transcriptional regulator
MSSRPLLRPLAVQTTAGIVADRIREAIASGDISPGSQLSEVEYAAQLGVSRGPLREGLQRLTQEGLLIAHRNRGLFVIEMSPENVADIYLTRAALERAAAGRIHAVDPVGAADALEEVVEAMAAAAEREDLRAVSNEDIRFHQVLVEQSASPRLIRHHRTLLTETRMCIHAMEPSYERDELRVGEHRAVVTSFRAADAELTDRLLVEHMRDAEERLTGPSSAAAGDG